MIYIILIVIAVIAIWFLFTLKIPKFGNMVLVTGGVKTGKTMMCVHLATRTLKKQRVKVYIQNTFNKIFRPKKPLKPKPLLYSNVPLSVPYVPLTQDLLERRTRFVYGSVIYVCESSLVADSMAYKDDFVNEQLLLLNKLIAHETKGGYLFYDTQSISDNHYAIKRCLSNYFYIHHTIKWIPFFVVAYVRELKYSDDNSAVNTFEEDLEDSLKRVVIPKKVWKMYDCYCYSILTDHLPVECTLTKTKDLKATTILSFKKFKNLYGKQKEGDKKE